MPDSVSQSLVLAVDAGTTNTKVLLIRPATGAVVASSSRPVGITFPAPGWAEQDAEQLWQATAAAMAECLVRAPQGTTPAGVAITNQRESVVAWSRRTGAALGPVLGWQDVRTAESCRSLADREGAAEVVRDRTGLSLDPMFSAPKLRWLLDDAIARGADPDDVALGTIDAWLVFRLTASTSSRPATRRGRSCWAFASWTGTRTCSICSVCPGTRSRRSAARTAASGGRSPVCPGSPPDFRCSPCSPTRMRRCTTTGAASRVPERPPTAPAHR